MFAAQMHTSVGVSHLVLFLGGVGGLGAFRCGRPEEARVAALSPAQLLNAQGIEQRSRDVLFCAHLHSLMLQVALHMPHTIAAALWAALSSSLTDVYQPGPPGPRCVDSYDDKNSLQGIPQPKYSSGKNTL